MERSHEEYISFDPFAGDKDVVDIRARTVRIVRTRKEHVCLLQPKSHVIAVGSLARFEKAVYEGEWCSWYACLECLDEELDWIDGVSGGRS